MKNRGPLEGEEISRELSSDSLRDKKGPNLYVVPRQERKLMKSQSRKEKEGEEIFIPSNTPHRLRCLAQKRARVMELWLGESDESDIVRLEDKYGRE